MEFCVYWNSRQYSLEEFLGNRPGGAFLQRVVALLENWKSGEDFLFRSSGSTGVPKEFRFTKSQVTQSANFTIEALGLIPEKEHILLCIDPQFVGGAMMVIRALLLNCPITLLEPKQDLWNEPEENHPFTFASFVPAQLAAPGFDRKKFQRINKVLIGGASLSEALLQQFSTCTNRIFQTYGMTETLSHVALKRIPQDAFYRCISPFRVRTGEEGRIYITSPYQEEELMTNDCGSMHGDDSFEVLGRLDHVINCGGIKLHPEQLELLISKIPGVPADDSWLVASVAHPVWGREAVIATKAFWEVELLNKVVAGLKEWGITKAFPRRQVLVDSIPRTANGKPLRKKVSEWLDREPL